MKATLVALVACVVVAVSALAPAWLAFAAVGLALGWTARVVIHWFLALRHKVLILLGLFGTAAMVMVLVSVSIPSLLCSRAAASKSHLVRYSADVRYEPSGPAWKIRDRIEVQVSEHQLNMQMLELQEAAVRGEVDFEELDALLDGDQSRLVDELQQHGWTCSPSSAESLVFHRQRTLATRQKWHAVRTDNRIPVVSSERDLPGSCKLYPYGELHLEVPRDFVGLTRPAATQRKHADRGKTETIVVPFEFPLLSDEAGEPFVQVEVLHPALRNPVVAHVRRLAGLPIINWLLVGVFGFFQEKLRARLVRPITSRLARCPGFRWLEESPTVPSRPETRSIREDGQERVSPPRPAHLPGILAALYDERDEDRKRIA